jgi:hypothetical protein
MRAACQRYRDLLHPLGDPPRESAARADRPRRTFDPSSSPSGLRAETVFSPRRTSIRTLFALPSRLRRPSTLPSVDLEDHVAAPETRVRGARIDGRDEHAAHVAREAQGLGDLGSRSARSDQASATAT